MPRKYEIENKAMRGLVHLAMVNREHWMVLAEELLPGEKIDQQRCLAEKMQEVAIQKVEGLAKPGDSLGTCKNQSPWMLESASNYLRAATFLERQANLGSVAMVNSAIAIEIILKSFSAEVVRNMRIGTIGEQYKINGRLHSLYSLSEKIDRETYNALGFERFKETFIKYDSVFMTARYPYEANAHTGFNSALTQVGIEIFNETIGWYKRTGNADQWVQDYPNVTGGAL